MDPRAGLDASKKRKTLVPTGNLTPVYGSSSRLLRHCTGCELSWPYSQLQAHSNVTTSNICTAE
jgi:hypothetical protein